MGKKHDETLKKERGGGVIIHRVCIQFTKKAELRFEATVN